MKNDEKLCFASFQIQLDIFRYHAVETCFIVKCHVPWLKVQYQRLQSRNSLSFINFYSLEEKDLFIYSFVFYIFDYLFAERNKLTIRKKSLSFITNLVILKRERVRESGRKREEKKRRENNLAILIC